LLTRQGLIRGGFVSAFVLTLKLAETAMAAVVILAGAQGKNPQMMDRGRKVTLERLLAMPHYQQTLINSLL
jgi:hypothetical protein